LTAKGVENKLEIYYDFKINDLVGMLAMFNTRLLDLKRLLITGKVDLQSK